jgi:hypothetical protein
LDSWCTGWEIVTNWENPYWWKWLRYDDKNVTYAKAWNLQEESGLGGAPHVVRKGRFVGWSLLRGGPTQTNEARAVTPVFVGIKQVTHNAWLAAKEEEKWKRKKKKKKEASWFFSLRHREREVSVLKELLSSCSVVNPYLVRPFFVFVGIHFWSDEFMF